MKRMIVVLALMLVLSGKAWALPDNVQPSEYTGSQQIKTKPATIYSVNVNYIGVTAGDKVQMLDGGASGTIRFTCVASSANGTCPSNFTVGALFQTDVYLKESKSGGNFYTDIQMF